MITSENLFQFLRENDTDAVFTALKSMSEQERSTLNDEALRATSEFYFRAARTFAALTQGFSADQIEAYLTDESTPLWVELQQFESARVAVLFCCDFETLKAADEHGLPTADYCLKVMSHRRPKWIKKWCEWALKKWPMHVWHTVFELEKQLLDKVKGDTNHYIAMAFGLPSVSTMRGLIQKSPSLQEEFYSFLSSREAIRAMAASDAVTRDLWLRDFRRSFMRAPSGHSTLQMFQHGTHSSASEASRTKGIDERWIECIGSLAESGTVDLGRLVEISFENLTSYAELQQKPKGYPSDESLGKFLCLLNSRLCPERTPYLSRYAALTGATNSDISIYAITILLTCPDKDLPIEAVLSSVSTAFRNRDKDPAVIAIKLLDKIAQIPRARIESLGLTVMEAFNHKSKTIHKDALLMLEKAQLCENEVVRLKLQKSLDLLQGENRTFATKLLGRTRLSETAAKEEPVQNNNYSTGDASSISVQLVIPNGLNEDWKALVGLSKIIENAENNSPAKLLEALLAPVDLVSMSSPRLEAGNKVQPIETLDDLIFLAASAFTGPLTSEKAELLLDGIARLGSERPPDFDAKVKGLRASVEALWQTNTALGGMPVGIVISAWLDGQRFDKDRISFRSRIFEARCAGLAARLWAGIVLPLLAAPTHKEGWIDPIALVRRVKTYQANGRLLSSSGERWPWPDTKNFVDWLANASAYEFSVDAPEFIQAILRLSPDGRENALPEAQSVTGEFGKALRFALGEGDIKAIERPEFAIAAFRSRFPRAVCKEVSNPLIENMPDGIEPATYQFNDAEVAASLADGYRSIRTLLPDFLSSNTRESASFPIAVKFARSYTESELTEINNELLKYLLYPTVSLHSSLRHYSLVEDCSKIWMQNKEPLLARLAKEVLLNIDSVSSGWHNDFSIFFNPDFPLYENGSWWLALALAAKQDQFRTLALDILIAAIEENRVDAVRLAESMSRLSNMTQSRWTASIRELARVSPLHAIFAWKLLNAFVTFRQEKTGLGFLEVVLEFQDTYGLGLMPEAVEGLQKIQGSGKAAKIAKALAANGDRWKRSDTLREAAEQSVKSRVARIERWQTMQCYQK